MKWIRMVLLHFERTIEYRLRSFLWILIPMSNNLTLILFWSGSKEQMSYISTYYILMTIGGLFLTSHVEGEVADIDIKQGELVNYLTKPISYYWINFIGELPYRVLQMVYAAILIGAFLLFFHGNLAVIAKPMYFPLIIVIFTLGYFISFTFKLSIAYLSFWFKDMRGFYELTTILSIIFSGAVMPLEWYPQGLRTAAHFLPFAYSNYYPVMVLMKPFGFVDLLNIVFIQGIWLCILLLIHRYLWDRGIKEFTAVGQ